MFRLINAVDIFTTVTRTMCALSVMRLACSRDTLIDIYNVTMGNLEPVTFCKGGMRDSVTPCEVTNKTLQYSIVNVEDSCQGKMWCDINFPLNLVIDTCPIKTLRLTYFCNSKYCLQINKSSQLVINYMLLAFFSHDYVFIGGFSCSSNKYCQCYTQEHM